MANIHKQELIETWCDRAPEYRNDESEMEHHSKGDTTHKAMGKGNLPSNTRALKRTATTYELEKFTRSIMIVFVIIDVNYKGSIEGINKDVEALRNTFRNLKFKVDVKRVPTTKEIDDELEKMSENDFTDNGCISVAVLNYYDQIMPKNYNEENIMKHLTVYKNRTLFTKPRIIILQTCRAGVNRDNIGHADTISQNKDCDAEDSFFFPSEPDILILHASYMRKPSYMDATGSWFIQSLCNKLNELSGDMDFSDIIMEVKREVAIDREFVIGNINTDEYEIVKQMPVLTSTLTRKIYFKKYETALTTGPSFDGEYRSSEKDVSSSSGSEAKPFVQNRSSTNYSSDGLDRINRKIMDNMRSSESNYKLKEVDLEMLKATLDKETQVARKHRSEDETSKMRKREEIRKQLDQIWLKQTA